MASISVPTVNLLIIQNDKALLSRRKNAKWMDGYLVLPGGHIEDKETPTQAIIREAKEELDLDLTEEDLSCFCVGFRKNDPNPHVAFEFVTYNESLKPRNAEPHKCSELIWRDLNELGDDVVPDFEHIIKEGYLSKNIFLEIGF